ncbi:MAG TPA: ROK family protein, partial [bacterium]|nr:ROK family protein [bacterium]
MSKVIGVDIGGTKILSAIVDENGNTIKTVRVPSEGKEGRDRILYHLYQTIEELISRDIIGIGIGTAGQVDPDTGVIVTATPNLKDWAGTPLKDIIEDRFNLPTYVDNDGNVAALGEWWIGGGRGARCLLCLTIGTGIGSGIVYEGKVFRGAKGVGAELGHMSIKYDGIRCNCGGIGCIEAYASGPALMKKLQEKGKFFETPDEIQQAAESGDRIVLEAVKEIGILLGYAMVSFINIFNPDIILLSGGVSNLGDFLIGPVRDIVDTYALAGGRDVKIGRAVLGENAGVVGAAALVYLK